MEATYPPRHVRQIKASTAALATIQADGSVVFPDAVLQSAAIAPMSNPRMFSVFKPQCSLCHVHPGWWLCGPNGSASDCRAIWSHTADESRKMARCTKLRSENVCTLLASGFHQPCGTRWHCPLCGVGMDHATDDFTKVPAIRSRQMDPNGHCFRRICVYGGSSSKVRAEYLGCVFQHLLRNAGRNEMNFERQD